MLFIVSLLEGTFNAITKELDRIKALGTDIIWFLPFYPIGEVKRKGLDGSPYAIKDYRTVDSNYGSIEDFEALVEEIHQRGMKVMIDVVYNHTSPDSLLVEEHPEWYYKTPEGNFGNRVGDWSDIVDLDYSHNDLWDYQIETLKLWVERGVDGFRCDVAPLIPIEFWLRAREEVDAMKNDLVWLSESVHPEFIRYLRSRGMIALSDSEIYQAFDMTYDYDVHDHRQAYLENDIDLRDYIERLKVQDYTYPWNYIKLRNLENHDHPRFKSFVENQRDLDQWLAFNYMQKGSALIYNGQEVQAAQTPSLFDKDLIDWNTQTDISQYLAKLAHIKKEILPIDGIYSLEAVNDKDTVIVSYEHPQQQFFGIFNLKESQGELEVIITDGTYVNLLTDDYITIKDGRIDISETPVIFQVNN